MTVVILGADLVCEAVRKIVKCISPVSVAVPCGPGACPSRKISNAMSKCYRMVDVPFLSEGSDVKVVTLNPAISRFWSILLVGPPHWRAVPAK
jgi:hypothetical protein